MGPPILQLRKLRNKEHIAQGHFKGQLESNPEVFALNHSAVPLLHESN